MKIYTYIVAVDSGYAPNPFFGWCTLACCKPAIRRGAERGDWVVGIAPKRDGHGLVYAMRVRESLSFEDYWGDRRFQRKRPVWSDELTVARSGDNCYQPKRRGGFRQLRCSHSRADGSESPGAMARDLGGERVLISRHFSYFGAEPDQLPRGLPIPGIGHRVVRDPAIASRLAAALEELPRGRHGWPRRFVEAGAAAACRPRRPRCG